MTYHIENDIRHQTLDKNRTLDIGLQTLNKKTPLLSGERRERFPLKDRL